MSIRVTSEVGKLRGVITHTPGREVSLVTPEIKDELLFDDIIYEENARNEHLQMLQVIKSALPDVTIIEVADLFLETFKQADAREYFIDRLIENFPEGNIHPVKKELVNLAPESLVRFGIQGQTPEMGKFKLFPIPNLLFTRDLAAVVGSNIVISRAAMRARVRESYLMDTVVRYHPMYESIRNKVIRISKEDSIEGGDIIIASDDLVIIGMSERTSFSGVMRAGEHLLSNGLKQVLIVDIPKQRASMHLDTIFTFCDVDECVVYPPAIINRSENVVSLTKKGEKIISQLKPSLKLALEEALGYPFRFIKCGGDDKVAQQREQWSDGANHFALAPGVVIGYERNIATFQEMEKYGYEIVPGREFIRKYSDGSFDISKAGKMVITFEGNELCRGRGGARCMTQPFLRDPLSA